jgi:predicted GH43/DUF377 family glycosyl hydrolase
VAKRSPAKAAGLKVERLDISLNADPSRVLLRRYSTSGPDQARNVISRVLALPEGELPQFLETVMGDFEGRHHEFRQALLQRFREIQHLLTTDQELSKPRQMLMGASFSMEYSLECAALFNPSIVLHPDQSGIAKGAVRFVLSLRATGEGHISSITFRVGTVDAKGTVIIEPASRFVIEPKAVPNPSYERALFGRKLHELGLSSAFTRRVVQSLDDEFTLQDLRNALSREHWRSRNLESEPDQIANVDDKILALALSNYQVQFQPTQPLSEQVLFPVTPSQSNGIEDARFVRFEDGTYYGTYTAYDGRMIMPQLVETDDFINYRFITLNGPAVKNKGMALFPRKINGLYAMLGRQDGENLTLMMSDNIHFWNEARIIVRPKFSWELVQIGNCGSPIETEAGWLVLTHGVGPARKYSIGALILDRDDPSKVVGRLREPLLSPGAEEREGYVPNVVYTCGALVHGENLIVPYAVSDSATRFARVNLKALLAAMS